MKQLANGEEIVGVELELVTRDRKGTRAANTESA